MRNYVDFPVKCSVSDGQTQKIRVYYVWHNNRWFPLPPNICDNSNNSDICQRCIADVIEKALKYDLQTP